MLCVHERQFNNFHNIISSDYRMTAGRSVFLIIFRFFFSSTRAVFFLQKKQKSRTRVLHILMPRKTNTRAY